MFLIVGLGNPGTSYQNNRHNVGFLFIDWFQAKNFPRTSFQDKFQSQYLKDRFMGEDIILLKPQTYMNLSGEAVRETLRFFKMTPQDLIVITDDLDQEPLALKTRQGGGHGGHNGLRSLIDLLGDENFYRVKIGIGKPEYKTQVSDYVLGNFSSEEQTKLQSEIFEEAHKRLVNILKQEIKKRAK
jgi:PTH1 family peptidyl-tRNA hydrolase